MSNHDVCVKRRAEAYKKEKWSTYAALPGYSEPPKIYRKIPDIYAIKNKTTSVEEIETVETINTDQAKEQIKAFRKWQKESPTGQYRIFTLYLADKNGTCIKQN